MNRVAYPLEIGLSKELGHGRSRDSGRLRYKHGVVALLVTAAVVAVVLHIMVQESCLAANRTGRIALPYPSDYGYATDFNKCSRNLYNYESCKNNDWMYPIITNSGNDAGWLLTPLSYNSEYALVVVSSGFVCYSAGIQDHGRMYRMSGVVPVLFLSSDEGIESGLGTMSEPYQLLGN